MSTLHIINPLSDRHMDNLRVRIPYIQGYLRGPCAEDDDRGLRLKL
jgi:hypothetical protein